MDGNAERGWELGWMHGESWGEEILPEGMKTLASRGALI